VDILSICATNAIYTRLSALSIDQSGDFLAFNARQRAGTIISVVYGTFFDIRRAYGIPEVDFALQPCKMTQPQPVAMAPPSLVGTWWNYSTSISGDQLDSLRESL
jgi:hypothetical protein